jgi:hypothetical protein
MMRDATTADAGQVRSDDASVTLLERPAVLAADLRECTELLAAGEPLAARHRTLLTELDAELASASRHDPGQSVLLLRRSRILSRRAVGGLDADLPAARRRLTRTVRRLAQNFEGVANGSLPISPWMIHLLVPTVVAFVGMFMNPGRPGLGNAVFALGLTWLFLTFLALFLAGIFRSLQRRRLR